MQYKLMSLLFFILLATSCATNNITSYGKLDKNEKTITVPAGGGVLADIKTTLKKNGWGLKIDSNSIKTEGTGGSTVNQVAKVESSTRYRMITSFSGQRCITCSCVKTYNISIIDNKSGEEIVTFDATDPDGICYKTVSERVISWLRMQ